MSKEEIEQVINRRLEQEEVPDWGVEPEPELVTGAGPLPEGWHRHPNGGGLVQDTATVADTAFVERDAKVYGYALVRGNAWVYGDEVVDSGERS